MRETPMPNKHKQKRLKSAKNTKQQNQPKQTGKHNTANNQVRIVGGQFKRRNISFIDADGLRPTPDRMRETLFNWLMHDTFDAKVLDTCAGSGVLGFEALSRGASQCVFIEANNAQANQLKQSADNLKLTNQQAVILTGKAEEVIKTPAFSSVGFSSTDKAFNIVFVDPPYSLHLWQPILDALIQQQLIDGQTLIYIEADKAIEAVLNPHTLAKTTIIKEKSMGQVNSWLIQIQV